MNGRATLPQQFGPRTKSPESIRGGDSIEGCLESTLPIKEGGLLAEELERGPDSSVAPRIKKGYGNVFQLASC